VKYECPRDGTSYILVIRNALHVPSMTNNLIPPFMMREAGITVHDTPKIQVSDPDGNDHSIFFPETKLRIPLSLWGVFSYFPTSKPTALEMTESEEIYMLTPSRWDPHQTAYAKNEENMIDWKGNMIEKSYRQQLILSEIDEDTAMASSVQIGSIEVKAIDLVMETVEEDSEKPHPCYQHVPCAADQVSSVLASVSTLLDDQILYEWMAERASLGKFQASIGSTNVTDSEYILDEEEKEEIDPNTDDEHLLDKLYEGSLQGEIDLDDIMVSAAHAGRSKGIDAEHLDPKHGALTWRLPSGLLISLRNTVCEKTTLPSHGIMEQMTECYGTKESTNTSLWILSLLRR
jgi:hypothetical protein